MITYKKALESSIDYFDGDQLAAEVFLGKYALTDPKGNLLEKTPEDMHRRLAREIARIEEKFPNPMSEEELFNLFDQFRYVVPQGSPMAVIGDTNRYQSAGNCFVIESPYDSYSGILKTDQEMAQLMKRRCGVGTDISTLRPKGMQTKNAAKTTDGIAVFMERFSNTCREVAQGGRRGALMLSLSIHHPEILTAITIKKDRKKVTGANISIRLTDEFLTAVRKNEDYEVRWPVDSEEPVVSKRLNAKMVWDEICNSAHDCAEPGILFWDNITKGSPANCYKEIDPAFKDVSTNPSLKGETLVLTKDGVFPIKELAETNPLVEIKNINGEWQQAKVFCSGKNKQLMKITFSNGQTVYCTKEHKWPILNSTNQLVDFYGRTIKRETQELKNGNKIYFPQFEKPINNPKCNLLRKDGFVLGWITGDGWITKHKSNNSIQFGFIFSENEIEIGETILEYTNNLARTKSTLRQDHNHKAKTYVTTDKNVGNHFKNNLGAVKKELGIPSSVWCGNHEFVCGYIDGLMSSDGYIRSKNKLSDCQMVLVSSHQKLAYDFQKLLSFYGIRSNIKKTKTTNACFPNGKKYNKTYTRFDLSISGNHVVKFAKIFTLTSKDKQNKLDQILEIAKKDKIYTKNKRDYLNIFSVEETDMFEDVYDITVFDETHTFLMETGVTGNCSEIPMGKDSCRLTLMNLTSFVENSFTGEAKFDYPLFAEKVQKAQRIMDDIVELEGEYIARILQKIEDDPEPDEVKRIERNLWTEFARTCKVGRRTGLGITGLGDALAALGIKYGSKKSIEITERIYRTLAVNAYKSSCQMAKERGAFEIFDRELEKDNEYLQQVINADRGLKKLYEQYGRRNVACLTTAPAGSVSVLTQTTSGIEPVFLLTYTRRKKINPNDKAASVDFIDKSGDRWQEYEVNHHGYQKWIDVNGIKDPQVKDSPYHKSTSADIDWEASIDLQAAGQRWVDHAISKTCNLPEDTTVATVKKVYMKAWTAGCKGFTIYRENSRSGVLVSKKNINRENLAENHAPKRPESLPCDIYHITVDYQKWNAFVGLYEGKPFEIFAGLAKYVKIPQRYKKGRIEKHNGGTTATHYDLCFGDDPEDEMVVQDIDKIFENPTGAAFTRVASLSLRHGTPVQYAVEQIVKGSVKESNLFSLNKAVARVLKNYILDGTKPSQKKCENCGSTDLAYEEGCATCKACGIGKCN